MHFIKTIQCKEIIGNGQRNQKYKKIFVNTGKAKAANQFDSLGLFLSNEFVFFNSAKSLTKEPNPDG